jgi:CheY-like chemotaxis protein
MPKILVVEDMPDSAELAAQILRKYGHEVLLAETGEAALRLAQEQLPQLIVYDYWLPDIDARTFLTRLRSVDGLDKIPVIVCTATPTAAIQEFIGERGFDGHINKPYRLSNFMQVIEEKLTAVQ